jgi:hypothetical protein
MLTSRFGAFQRNSKWNQHVRFFQVQRALPPDEPKNWQYASLEALQRLVLIKAIQFILYEPVGRVEGNDEFKVAADRMIEIVVAQLKTLKTKKSDW